MWAKLEISGSVTRVAFFADFVIAFPSHHAPLPVTVFAHPAAASLSVNRGTLSRCEHHSRLSSASSCGHRCRPLRWSFSSRLGAYSTHRRGCMSPLQRFRHVLQSTRSSGVGSACRFFEGSITASPTDNDRESIWRREWWVLLPCSSCDALAHCSTSSFRAHDSACTSPAGNASTFRSLCFLAKPCCTACTVDR